VRIGKEGLETFVYRGDVANNALKMAGQEIGLFLEKSEASHRYAKYDELTEAELLRQIRDEAQLLLEHHEREACGEADGNGARAQGKREDNVLTHSLTVVERSSGCRWSWSCVRPIGAACRRRGVWRLARLHAGLEPDHRT